MGGSGVDLKNSAAVAGWAEPLGAEKVLRGDRPGGKKRAREGSLARLEGINSADGPSCSGRAVQRLQKLVVQHRVCLGSRAGSKQRYEL